MRETQRDSHRRFSTVHARKLLSTHVPRRTAPGMKDMCKLNEGRSPGRANEEVVIKSGYPALNLDDDCQESSPQMALKEMPICLWGKTTTVIDTVAFSKARSQINKAGRSFESLAIVRSW